MFAQRLREERIKKGLSQEELGKRFSVTQQAIYKWETDKSSPDPEMIRKLADFFGCTTDYLLGKSDTPNPDEATEKIKAAITDDPELLSFWEELSEREDLQLMFKQVRDLSPQSIKKIIRVIKAIEDEESMED